MASMSNRDSSAAARIYSVFGLLNLVFAGLGLLSMVADAWGFFALPPGLTSPGDLIHRVFFAAKAVEICILTPLALAGFRLLKGGGQGILISSIVFLTEISCLVVLWIFHGQLISRIVTLFVFRGITNIGFAVQMWTAYPLVGLVLLNFARWKERNSGGARLVAK